MSEELQKEVEVWNQQKNRLAIIVDGYTALTIDGHAEGPVAGYAVVSQARNVLRKERTQIEARRVELKATVLDVGRKIDKAAKELTAVIAPKEQELQAQIDIVDGRERTAKDAEAQRKADALQAKVQALLNVGIAAMPLQVSLLSDEEYGQMLATATAQKEAQRLQREEEDRQRAEELRKIEEHQAIIRAEQEKLDAAKREQQAEADRLATQRREQEETQARIKANEEEVKRRAEAEALRVEAETQARATREREEKEEKKRLELCRQEEQQRRLALVADEKARAEALLAARIKSWEETIEYRQSNAKLANDILFLLEKRIEAQTEAEESLLLGDTWLKVISICDTVYERCLDLK